MITGAKGGLGIFVTKAFLDAGANVVGVSRSIQDADFAYPTFAAVNGELSNLEGARAVADAAAGRLQRIDALVHLVGGYAGGERVELSTDATLEQMFDINFRTFFRIARAVLPRMRDQHSGCILAIGSKAAVDPPAGLGAYSASKAALISLVKTLAAENREFGIAVNIVLPGTMDTLQNRAAMPDADFSKWVPPSQVASLLVWLASPEASSISGAVIPIYGREA